MTPGEFTSFVIALLMLYEPVKRLTGIHNIFQQALGASQRVFEYLDREQHVQEKAGAAELAKFQHSIRLENVSFRYPSAPDGFTLTAIELEVNAGEIVALVGPSGAGKTTLVNLVPRFYDVTGGIDPAGRQRCPRSAALLATFPRSALWHRTLFCSTIRWPIIQLWEVELEGRGDPRSGAQRIGGRIHRALAAGL